MDVVDLLKYVSSDLTWKTVKKGHRTTRHPKRPGASDKVQDAVVSDYEKSGVAILGQHFDEAAVVDVPIKKRILLLESPSLNGEHARSPPQSHLASPHREDSQMLVSSSCALVENVKVNEKKLPNPNDFSGIELLADAACYGTIYENSGHMDSMDVAPMDSEDLSVQDSTVPVTQCLFDNGNVMGNKSPVSTKPVKFLWDLNAPPPPEDWEEEPSCDMLINPQPVKSCIEDTKSAGLQNVKNNLETINSEVTEVVEEPSCDMLIDPQPVKSCIEDTKSAGLQSVKNNLKTTNSEVTEVVEEPSCDMLIDPQPVKSCIEDIKSDSLQIVKTNLEAINSEVMEEPSCDNLIDSQPVKSCFEDIKSYGLQNAKTSLETIDSQVTEVKKGIIDHGATFSVVPFSKPEALDTQGNDDVGSRDVVGTIKCKVSDAESCDISKSDVVDSFIHPAKCENVSTSTDSVSQEQTTVRVEPIVKSDEGQSVSEVLQGVCLSAKGYDDKPTLEDRISDFCGSNASEDEHAEGNTIDKVKAGYDSPVEDGELREPDRFPWQDEEVEERECVDYESDNMYEDNFDGMESSENETSLDQHQNIGAAVCAETINGIEHDDRVDVSDRMNNLQAHSQSAYNESGGGGIPSLDRSTSTSFGVPKAGVSGGYIRRSRSDNIGNTYSRDRSDFGPGKFMGRDRRSYQRRTPYDAGGQWGDSFSRNSHGYPRPKNVIGGSVVRNGVENKEPISYNPRANYRAFNAGEINESYASIHRGPPPPPPPPRSLSRDGLRRAPPQEYKAPGPFYTKRKVSSFSSNFNQSGHISRSRKRSRSRSRSRSGSPIAWHFQKKGNLDTKEQSPDYRPDTRLPLHKTGETESRLGPPTRCHVSPQCVSRSFDDRNVISGQYRDRRSSPVRTFHQDQRFEAGGYPGRFKSDDHFRPTPHPERFPGNREKFAANRDDKYGMMNRGRPFRNDKNDYIKDRKQVNGFRYTPNEDRSFRDPVRQDIPKNTSEENGCRYTTNKMFNTEKGDFHKDN